MRLILDTNIIMSALIRDSITRKMMIESGWRFYYPKESLQELEKYKFLILEKSGLSEEEYTNLYNFLISHIFTISSNRINENFKEADNILGKIDPNDVIFIALALSIENEGIWSDDSHFQQQEKVKIWKTGDVVRKFESFGEQNRRRF